MHEACVDTLSASVVTADEILVATQTGLDHIDQKRILGGFALLSTPDVIKVIQTLPGVASGTELMSGLYVHGGNGSDNLFILDGVPLYQVSHLAGLFSSFNADVV
ncbi:MAG: Plug domain-containing protein, partial [Bacteroidales bacterium]|nr:Plug domain-containing protein [Bacteroidales bacterium]